MKTADWLRVAIRAHRMKELHHGQQNAYLTAALAEAERLADERKCGLQDAQARWATSRGAARWSQPLDDRYLAQHERLRATAETAETVRNARRADLAVGVEAWLGVRRVESRLTELSVRLQATARQHATAREQQALMEAWMQGRVASTGGTAPLRAPLDSGMPVECQANDPPHDMPAVVAHWVPKDLPPTAKAPQT